MHWSPCPYSQQALCMHATYSPYPSSPLDPGFDKTRALCLSLAATLLTRSFIVQLLIPQLSLLGCFILWFFVRDVSFCLYLRFSLLVVQLLMAIAYTIVFLLTLLLKLLFYQSLIKTCLFFIVGFFMFIGFILLHNSVSLGKLFADHQFFFFSLFYCYNCTV